MIHRVGPTSLQEPAKNPDNAETLPMPDAATWTPSPIQPMRPLPPNSPSPAPILKQASSWKLGEEENASEGGEEEDPEEEDAVIDECLEVVCHGDDPVIIDSGDETVLSPDPKNKKKDHVHTMDYDSYWRVEEQEMGQDLKEHDAKGCEMKKDSETGEDLQPPAKKSKQLKETPEATTSCLKSEGPKPKASSNLEETPAQLAAKQQQLEDALQSEDEPVDRKTAFKVGGGGYTLYKRELFWPTFSSETETFITVVYCTVLLLLIIILLFTVLST